MIYAIILAAGTGTRFNSKPIKPLYKINNNPIFLHSLDIFLSNKNVNHILLLIPPNYFEHFRKYLKSPKYKNVLITYGDQTARWKSLERGMLYLQRNFKLNRDDIIITHDAARINISNDLINKNILTAQKHGYASTMTMLTDSICKFKTNSYKYLDRSNIYLVQTPQSIQYQHWMPLKKNNSNKPTDLFSYLHLPVTKRNLVIGRINNYKITFNDDLN